MAGPLRLRACPCTDHPEPGRRGQGHRERLPPQACAWCLTQGAGTAPCNAPPGAVGEACEGPPASEAKQRGGARVQGTLQRGVLPGGGCGASPRKQQRVQGPGRVLPPGQASWRPQRSAVHRAVWGTELLGAAANRVDCSPTASVAILAAAGAGQAGPPRGSRGPQASLQMPPAAPAGPGKQGMPRGQEQAGDRRSPSPRTPTWSLPQT